MLFSLSLRLSGVCASVHLEAAALVGPDMDPRDRKLLRRAKAKLRAQTDEHRLQSAMLRMQRRVDTVRQQRDVFVDRDHEPAHDVAWKAFKKREGYRNTPEHKMSLDLSGVQQPDEQEEFHTKLSARLKWTKNFEARSRAQAERSASQLSQAEAEVEERVAKLAAGHLGNQMRLTGNFAGHETEAAAANRRGARDAFDEPGFIQRRSIAKKRDLRLGRASAEPGAGSSSSMSNTEKILALQGRTSAPPMVSLSAVHSAKRAAKKWRNKAEASAAAKGESVRSQLPRGVLPETVLLRAMVDKDSTGPSIQRESFAGEQSKYANPQHARVWRKIDSVKTSPPPKPHDHRPLNLTQNIRTLEEESERIEAKLGARTRVLPPCRVTAPSRVI
eukprot:COSAG05_NODE_1015_length_6188_cov_162.395139_4_plen_388_part_00